MGRHKLNKSVRQGTTLAVKVNKDLLDKLKVIMRARMTDNRSEAIRYAILLTHNAQSLTMENKVFVNKYDALVKASKGQE